MNEQAQSIDPRAVMPLITAYIAVCQKIQILPFLSIDGSTPRLLNLGAVADVELWGVPPANSLDPVAPATIEGPNALSIQYFGGGEAELDHDEIAAMVRTIWEMLETSNNADKIEKAMTDQKITQTGRKKNLIVTPWKK